MFRNTTVACMCLVVGTLADAALGQVNSFEAAGKVEAVTVYRGQALVTRLVDIPGPAGLYELVVTELPEHVVPESLYAESSDGLEVRSVLYRQRPVTQDVRQEVRDLDDRIRSAADMLAQVAQNTALLAERKALLEKLEAFTAPTANVELTKGVLNPTTLKEMADYLIAQRQSVSEEDLQLKFAKRDLEEQLALLRRQRDQVAGASAKTSREALVFLNLENAKGQMRLRYLVNHANWSPSYTARAGEGRQQVSLEYYASIQQMSGENWSDVAMTLSTATPSLVAKAPTLEPLHLSLTAEQRQEVSHLGKDEFYRYQQELGQRKIMLNDERGRAGQAAAANLPGAPDLDASLNRMACDLQILEWASSGDIKKANEKAKPEFGDGLSVTYQLAGRTSLPSRSDRQLIQIAALPLKGEFYKLAVPVLSDSVYDEAWIKNATNTVLLAGPVSTYLGGEFVGHGKIPTVAAGEGFTLGFGIDSSMRAARELYEKDETLQGGNRVVNLTYRLMIENFGAQNATVRVLDRQPMSNGSEVKATLVSNSPKVSEDAAYKQNDFKKGILRWDVPVPAQAIGASAAAVEYQLRLEYDKQMSITGVALATP